MTGRRYLAAVVYAVAGAIVVYGFRAVLVPDTAGYAAGHGAWSSPALAFAGRLDGLEGVRLGAVTGAAALGWTVASAGGSWVLLLAGLWVLPYYPGLTAGPDGLGAAGAVSWYTRREGTSRARTLGVLLVVCALHLAAGLCCAAALAANRLTRSRMPVSVAMFVGGAGAICGELVTGYAIGVPPDQLQVRYLLPALAVSAVSLKRWATRRPETVAERQVVSV